MSDLVHVDPVRRPIRYLRSRPETVQTVADIEGWQLLALVIEGRITGKQAQAVNGKRLRILHAETKRAAA